MAVAALRAELDQEALRTKKAQRDVARTRQALGFALEAAQAAPQPAAARGLDMARFRDQGYLVLPGVLAQKEVEQMRDQVMEAWRERKGPFDPEKTWLQNSLLVDVHHFC